MRGRASWTREPNPFQAAFDAFTANQPPPAPASALATPPTLTSVPANDDFLDWSDVMPTSATA